MPPLLIAMVLGLLGVAAWRDVATRTIPDRISIALCVMGAAYRLSEGWQALLFSLLVASGLFLVLVFCHARGVLGGADVKLLVSLAIGLPPVSAGQLLLATALAGGLLAVLYLTLARLLPRGTAKISSRGPLAQPCRIARLELIRIRRGYPLPYGVAIAVGALAVFTTPSGA